jgi:hypothetical protein
MLIVVYIYSRFTYLHSNAISSSNYVVSNDRTMSKKLPERDVERNVRDPT